MRNKIFVLILLCLFILFACYSEKKYWEKAEAKNTVEAYKTFLKHFPKGPLADKAYFKIEELCYTEASKKNTIEAYEEFIRHFPKGTFMKKAQKKIKKIRSDDRDPKLRNVKTVKIIVTESYRDAKGIRLPYKEVAKRLFDHAGLKVVWIEDCDLKLKIVSSGNPLSVVYSSGPLTLSQRLYSGASLEGSISIELQGISVCKKDFTGEIKPPEKILYSKKFPYQRPSFAPFEDAFYKRGSFVSKMMDMMKEIFGTSFLIAALRDSHSLVKKHAVEGLGEVKDPRTVEALINAYKDDDFRAKATLKYIILALSKKKDARVFDLLLNDLKNKEMTIFFGAEIVEALGELGDPRAIEPLLDIIWTKDSRSFQSYAHKALEKITGQDFGYAKKDWQKWWKKNKKKLLNDRQL